MLDLNLYLWFNKSHEQQKALTTSYGDQGFPQHEVDYGTKHNSKQFSFAFR